MSNSCHCHPVFKDSQNSSKQKPSYESSLVVYLKPESASKPLKSELICKLCEGCVWKPLRCSKCSAYACQQCLEPFVSSFNACPSCAAIFEARLVPKSVPEFLRQLKFNCADCDTQFDYDKALDHIKLCVKHLIGAVQSNKEENIRTKQKIQELT